MEGAPKNTCNTTKSTVNNTEKMFSKDTFNAAHHGFSVTPYVIIVRDFRKSNKNCGTVRSCAIYIVIGSALYEALCQF